MPPSDDDAALEDALRRSRTLADAPEPLVRRAIDLFAARARATPAPAAGLRRRLVAALAFDSMGAPGLAFGLRSDAAATRQLLYSADGRDIDVRVAGVGGGRWRIAGQVLGPDASGFARLRDAAGNRREAAWNEVSEFAFDDVEPGDWVLELSGGDWEVELPPLALRPAP
ncbi:MAG: hypothetical protein MUF03_09855 [Rubrivivax sp.]|nr:hypothetical protein [Rubrivivax sp.]